MTTLYARSGLKPFMPLALHTMTAYGEIVGYSFRDGERYYFCLDAEGVTSLMPADVVDNCEGNLERRYGL